MQLVKQGYGSGSAHREGAEAFTAPEQVNQRRYEALRAFFVDGLDLRRGRASGSATPGGRWSTWCASTGPGSWTLFAPPRKPGPPPGHGAGQGPGPGPGDRAAPRGPVHLRDLRAAGRPRTPRSTAPAWPRSSPRRDSGGCCATPSRPRAPPRPPPGATPGCRAPRGWTSASWPATIETGKAGLLLLIPDLVALRPARPGAHGPATPAPGWCPPISWLLSLLALKLTRTRRVSHVDDLLLADPAASLFAGLATLPKKSALTDYSYRTGHDHQRRFLAALDTKMIDAGLATADDAIFDLDFHAVMHWGHDPVLEKHYVPTRSQRARSVLTFFAQDTGTHNLVYANADLSKATQAREVIAFCDHWKAVVRQRPGHADHGPEGHHPRRARRTRRTAASTSSPCACAHPRWSDTSTPSPTTTSPPSPWTGPESTTGRKCTRPPASG